MAERKPRSPWVWVGWGCAGCMLVTFVGLAVLMFAGYRAARSFEASFRDPAARRTGVLETLGASTLPGGYEVIAGVRVPWVLEIAALGQVGKPAPGQAPRPPRLFAYLRGFQFLRRGTDEELEWLDLHDIRVERRVSLGQGELELGGARLRYELYDGALRIQSERGEGTLAVIDLRCTTDDGWLRRAVWLAPEVGSEARAAEAAIAELFGHFALCPQ